jgi:hypothetical protein
MNMPENYQSEGDSKRRLIPIQNGLKLWVHRFKFRAYVLFTLFVFVCAQWCPTRVDCIHIMAGVFYEARTAYPSQNGSWDFGPLARIVRRIWLSFTPVSEDRIHGLITRPLNLRTVNKMLNLFSNCFRLFVPYVYKYATFKITANLQAYQQCGARLFALWHTYM